MKIKNLLWLIVLALVWGPAFLLIKIIGQEIPPLTSMALRVALAAALLYLLMRWQGVRLPPLGPVWLHFAVTGLVSNALPFALTSWAEQYVDSALAAVLVGLTPLTTVVLAHFLTSDDRLTPAKTIGVLLGMAGLLVLLLPALASGVYATFWGSVGATGAAISYAIGIVYARRWLRGLPPVLAPTAQLLLATLYLLPLAWFFEQPATLPLPSVTTISALLVLAIGSTALPFILYFWLLERMNASSVAMVGYLIPIVATLLGVFVLHEPFTSYMMLGGGLILVGTLVVNEVLSLPRWVATQGHQDAPLPVSTSR